MSEADQAPSHPDPGTWWWHRRWQSYVALAGIIGLGGAALTGLVPQGAAPIVQSTIWALASIVGVYSGGATVVDAIAKLRGPT